MIARYDENPQLAVAPEIDLSSITLRSQASSPHSGILKDLTLTSDIITTDIYFYTHKDEDRPSKNK
jgi:hypothetical protein